MTRVAMLLGAALGLAAAAPATAQTVTFDGQASAGFIAQYGPTYQEGGLRFTTAQGSAFGLFSWGLGQSSNADADGATIALTTANDWLTITRTGGGAFSLASIDLADGFNSGTASTVPYLLVTGAGTTSGSFTLDRAKGLQTFLLGLDGVLSFALQAKPSGTFQLDNVVYSTGAAAVPEPAAWAMLIAGCGLAGGALRTRRRQGGRPAIG